MSFQLFLYNDLLFIVAGSRYFVLDFNRQKLCLPLCLRIKTMIASIKWCISPYLCSNIVKSFWFNFLKWCILILKPLYSRTEKLKRKWFLFYIERAFIYFILTWGGIFSFKLLSISLPSCLVFVCSIIQRIKKGSNCLRFKMPRCLVCFLFVFQIC
jgi:hypothetical protein